MFQKKKFPQIALISADLLENICENMRNLREN